MSNFFFSLDAIEILPLAKTLYYVEENVNALVFSF
jgi:hypothetical protein